MAAKPRITIVGAGNLGWALGLALRKAGYRIDLVVSRASGASLARARALANRLGSRALAAREAKIKSEVVWLCVPDAQIANVAKALAKVHPWKGRVALHSSGALTSDDLSALRRRGAAVASIHPLMTFVRGARPELAGVPFAIEGDAAALRVGRRIVVDLGGKTSMIRKADKAAYHAWSTFTSPLLTAFLATTEHVAGAAGVRREAAKQRMLPILRQTLANYMSFGPRGSFSGPIVRGDIEVVKRHLHVLAKIPLARDVYVTLARAALLYLPARNRRRLREALK